MPDIAGKYNIIKELGSGASGKVYLVEHHELKVKCALKVLQVLIQDQKLVDRFKQEASLLMRFSHPGSLQLRDFGKTEFGYYYMVTEYCQGMTLKSMLAQHGALPPLQALTFALQILQTLSAAHKAGIIHRDIKPDNIMVVISPDGSESIKVMDFGIAKLQQDEALNSTNTVEGSMVGTPQYMSPEQAAGEKDLDERVDIYCVGVLLYELLSGKRPFDGETVTQTLLMQMTKAPDPFEAGLNIPEFVQEVVFRALEKDKEKRYPSADEFAQSCEEAMIVLRRPQPKKLKQPVEPKLAEAPAGGTRILCLDDDFMILQIMEHILKKEGYTVFTASDPAAIHDHVFNTGVQLLISDVQMPGLPGTKVCQMLKQSIPELKIVLFSNIDQRDLEKAANSSHADGWISKLTSPLEWLDKVKEVLQASESA